jgi:WD40 repeat protein
VEDDPVNGSTLHGLIARPIRRLITCSHHACVLYGFLLVCSFLPSAGGQQFIVKGSKGSVATGTIGDAFALDAQLRPLTAPPQQNSAGCAFSLRIHKVLYGSLDQREVRVTVLPSSEAFFVLASQSLNEQKVIAFLAPGQSTGTWSLIPRTPGIEMLRDFDAPAVKGLEEIFAVWRLPNVEDQVAAVKKGCGAENVRFRNWCLTEVSSHSVGGGLDLRGHISREEGDRLVLDAFAAEAQNLGTVVHCDRLLSKDADWVENESFLRSELRYRVFAAQLRRWAQYPEVRREAEWSDFQAVLAAVRAFPEQRETTWRILSELASPELPRDTRSAAHTSMYACYRTDIQDRLNQEILDYLTAALHGSDGTAASGAAGVVNTIATQYAEREGQVPLELMLLLRNPQSVHEEARDWFRLHYLPQIERLLSEPQLPHDERGTFAEHRGPVLDLAYSPDGTQLASIGVDRSIVIWDPVNWMRENPFKVEIKQAGDGVSPLTFSWRGVVAPNNVQRILRCWDPRSGKEVWSTEFHSLIHSLGFAPKADVVATGHADGSIQLWEASKGQLVRTLRPLDGHGGPVLSLAFSPDGRRLVSVSGDALVPLWNVATGQREASSLGGAVTRSAVRVAFSPDGSFVAVARSDHHVELVPVSENSRQRVRVLGRHDKAVTAVSVSSDANWVASASVDRTIKLWAVDGSYIPVTLRGHTDAVLGLAFAPNGSSLVSAGREGTVKFWTTPDAQGDRPFGADAGAQRRSAAPDAACGRDGSR